MLEGYTEAAPDSGIVMAVEFWKMAVPKPARLTVSRNEVLVLAAPSLTLTVIVAVPVWPLTGITVTVWTPLLKQTMFAFGTSVGLEDVALSIRLPTGLSGSEIVTWNGPDGVSTNVLRSASVPILGGRFPTVSTNESLASLKPSLTVTVIVAVPPKAATGVTVTVRLAPEPPNTILAFGTKLGLDELPLKVRSASGVSASLSVNAMGAVGVLVGVDWFGMSLIVGAVLVVLAMIRLQAAIDP
jgi:hypothetical protein